MGVRHRRPLSRTSPRAACSERRHEHDRSPPTDPRDRSGHRRPASKRRPRAEVAAIADGAPPSRVPRAARDHSARWRAGLLRAARRRRSRRDGAELVETATGGDRPRRRAPRTASSTRSAFQFRLFAEAVDEGGYLEAIDRPRGGHADGSRRPTCAGCSCRSGRSRCSASSNFPFAFSVAGGDTASALAAGQPGRRQGAQLAPADLAALVRRARRRGARAYGAPDGTLGIVYGQAAGRALVADPRDRRRRLHRLARDRAHPAQSIIDERETPIPFYGELSQPQPAHRHAGRGRAPAATRSPTGCSPRSPARPGSCARSPASRSCPPAPTATRRRDSSQRAARMPRAAAAQRAHPRRVRRDPRAAHRPTAGRAVARRAARPDADGFTLTPAVLEVDAADVTAARGRGGLRSAHRGRALRRRRRGARGARRRCPDSLTATIHAEADESDLDRGADSSRLQRRCVGRIVFNGYPTGVRVSWAQHHGGPWPATNTQHTSVGVTAIRRFLRPLAWQDAPEAVLPAELRDGAAACRAGSTECSSSPHPPDEALDRVDVGVVQRPGITSDRPLRPRAQCARAGEQPVEGKTDLARRSGRCHDITVGSFVGSLSSVDQSDPREGAHPARAERPRVHRDPDPRSAAVQPGLRHQLPARGASAEARDRRHGCGAVRHAGVQPLHPRRPQERDRLGDATVGSELLDNPRRRDRRVRTARSAPPSRSRACAAC